MKCQWPKLATFELRRTTARALLFLSGPPISDGNPHLQIYSTSKRHHSFWWVGPLGGILTAQCDNRLKTIFRFRLHVSHVDFPGSPSRAQNPEDLGGGVEVRHLVGVSFVRHLVGLCFAQSGTDSWNSFKIACPSNRRFSKPTQRWIY